MNKQTGHRSLAAIAITVLAASLLPLILLSAYARPAADDLGYGTPVHFALLSGKNVIDAVIKNIRYSYLFWQGSFSSVLLFSIQPGVFNETTYVLTPFVMLFSILFPIFFILLSLKTSDKSANIVIGCVLSFIVIQYLPSPAQGLYWWNGAAYYIFFWGMAVLVAAALINHINSSTFSSKFVIKSAIYSLAGIFIGGGNYPIALVFTLFLAGSLIYVFISGKTPYVKTAVFIPLLLTITALMVSVLAPGNTVRRETENLSNFSAAQAVILSLKQAIVDIAAAAADIKTVGAVLFCTPVILFSTKNNGFKFKNPLLVALASFCALAAMYMPSYYAMGNSGPLRLRNITWLTDIIFVFGNSFYSAGWVRNRVRQAACNYRKFAAFFTAIAGFCILTAGVVMTVKSTAAYGAYHDVRSGLTAAFLEEREERSTIYENKSMITPRFKPITKFPGYFYTSQIQTWSPDLLIDGVPADLAVARCAGCNVNFVGLGAALEAFGRPHASELSEYAKIYTIGGKPYVPLRELCDRLGLKITYDTDSDTILVMTSGAAGQTN